MSTLPTAVPGQIRSLKDRTLEQIILDVLHQGGGICFCRDKHRRSVELTVSSHGGSATPKIARYHIPSVELECSIVGPAAVLSRAANECERSAFG